MEWFAARSVKTGVKVTVKDANPSHFRQWVVSGMTQDDVDDARRTGTVKGLYSAELGCKGILRTPPGWLMLEHSTSGLTISLPQWQEQPRTSSVSLVSFPKASLDL